MPTNLAPGETVYVPWSRTGRANVSASALAKVKVLRLDGRKVVVTLPDGTESPPIAKAFVHQNPAVLVMRIGDFDTELSLLDPLAKSLLQYLRLLLPDDAVRLAEFRSLAELRLGWPKVALASTHVVLVGHGGTDSLKFGVDGSVVASALADQIRVEPTHAWSFLSLCCQTGYAGFAKKLSTSDVCSEVIAPFNSVHGAIASQFAQSYFAYRLLEGETTKVAFRHARAGTPGAVSFRLWRRGRMAPVKA